MPSHVVRKAASTLYLALGLGIGVDTPIIVKLGSSLIWWRPASKTLLRLMMAGPAPFVWRQDKEMRIKYPTQLFLMKKWS